MQQLWKEMRIKMVHLQPTASAFGRGMGTKVEKKARNKHGRRNGGISPPSMMLQVKMANARVERVKRRIRRAAAAAIGFRLACPT
jgi:hypothetical protein